MLNSERLYCRIYGNGYFTFVVDSYHTFMQEVAPEFAHTADTFVWRGMRDSNWTLQSSMSRELAKMETSNDDNHEWDVKATQFTIQQLLAYLQELRGLSQLNREYGRLHAALLAEENQRDRSFIDVLYRLKQHESSILELFAMGQHHRMLTPFLDWTTSPLIALYFAFEEADSMDRADGVGDRVVFALNKTAIEETCPPSQIPDDDWVLFMNSMAYDNQRIIGQHGLFSYVPSNQPLDRWVVSCEEFEQGRRPILIRFLIQNRDRENCLRSLHQTGTNARSVYPDLEGAALQANSLLKQKLSAFNEKKKSDRSKR